MDWHSLRWPVAVMMWSCRVRSQGRSVCTLWLADTPLLWSPVMSSWLAANTCRNTSCYFVLLAVCSSFTLTTINRIFFKPYSSLLGGFSFFFQFRNGIIWITLKFHLLCQGYIYLAPLYVKKIKQKKPTSHQKHVE